MYPWYSNQKIIGRQHIHEYGKIYKSLVYLGLADTSYGYLSRWSWNFIEIAFMLRSLPSFAIKLLMQILLMLSWLVPARLWTQSYIKLREDHSVLKAIRSHTKENCNTSNDNSSDWDPTTKNDVASKNEKTVILLAQKSSTNHRVFRKCRKTLQKCEKQF